MSAICPACETGVLSPVVRDKYLSYDGVKLLVPELEASVCPVCEERVVLPEQARRNERRYADARRKHDGLLTSSEIEGWRGRFGLTQQQAAALLGGGSNAFSKYERGEVSQSRSMDLLIRASDELADLRAFLASRVGAPFGRAEGQEVWESVKEIEPVAKKAQKQASADVVLLRVRQAACHVKANNDGKWQADDGIESELKYG